MSVHFFFPSIVWKSVEQSTLERFNSELGKKGKTGKEHLQQMAF